MTGFANVHSGGVPPWQILSLSIDPCLFMQGLTPHPDISGRSAPDPLPGAIQNPSIFDHPVTKFSLIETHISWILLTGKFAYKIKKPVNLGFADFSTLRYRRHYCEKEIRLNRRFAPDLYLDLVAIKGTRNRPRLNGAGKVIEFAIKMREFPQQNLLSTRAAEKRLQSTQIDSMADLIAHNHGAARKAATDIQWGSVAITQKWTRENIEQLESVVPEDQLPAYFENLKRWSLVSDESRLGFLRQRVVDGFIRECHGDLHLGNMVLIDGCVTLFDCIEFNEELRWIDTMSEIGFVAMDLSARGYSDFTYRFVNRYLQNTGDYLGIALLRYYLVYRAMVRAKVAAFRSRQSVAGNKVPLKLSGTVMRYLDLANLWTKNPRRSMILMHGFSGAGKSTAAQQLVEAMGAIQIRSDVERKRLFGFDIHARTQSGLQQGIYTPTAGEQTYQRLAELARIILDAGYPVIVDAAFLESRQRDRFKQLAQRRNVPYCFVSCSAPAEVLKDRIQNRAEQKNDVSEATSKVLHYQQQFCQPLTDAERRRTVVLSHPHWLRPAPQFEALIKEIYKMVS